MKFYHVHINLWADICLSTVYLFAISKSSHSSSWFVVAAHSMTWHFVHVKSNLKPCRMKLSYGISIIFHLFPQQETPQHDPLEMWQTQIVWNFWKIVNWSHDHQKFQYLRKLTPILSQQHINISPEQPTHPRQRQPTTIPSPSEASLPNQDGSSPKVSSIA